MIEESELIITSQGNIYHLDLQPGEIADTIITVGDPARVKEVSKHFNSIEIRREHREFLTHTGTFNNKRLSVVSTGIGTDNIDIVLTELDALVNIDFGTRQIKDKHTSLTIIRLGTSGSLQPEVAVDSFVAGSSAIGLDNLMLFYNINNDNPELLDAFKLHVLTDSKINAYQFNADELLIKQFEKGLTSGITVTCSGFYGPQGRMLRGPLRFPGMIDKLSSFSFHNQRITNFEMETSGIYGMSRLLGHKALSLSTIVANRVTKKFSADSNISVNKLIEHFFEYL